MEEKIRTPFRVKFAVGIFVFLAILIILVGGVFGYYKYSAYQDASKLENLTEDHIKVKFPEAKILQLKADTEIFGERQVHVIFEDEPQVTYSYLEVPPEMRQIKPNPPEEERHNYKYVE